MTKRLRAITGWLTGYRHWRDRLWITLLVFVGLFWNAYRAALWPFWFTLKGRNVFNPESLHRNLPDSFWQALAALGLAGVVFVIAAGLGRWLFRRLAIQDRVVAASCTEWAMGLAALLGGLGCLGVAGLLSPRNVCLYFFGLAALSGVFLWRTRSLDAPATSIQWNVWEAVLAGIVSFLVMHIVITALPPPTEADVMAYHLALPKIYLEAGGIVPLPWSLHSHWPHFFELGYMFPLAVQLPAGAALLHGLCVAMLGVLVSSFAYHEGNRTAAGLSLLSLICWPVLHDFSGTAHADGAVSLFAIASVWATWQGLKQKSRRWFLIAGILSGAMASCKLPALGLHVFMSFWIAWLGKKWTGAKTAALLFFASGLVIVAPWYLKTWTETGNPFWPFFYTFMGDTLNASHIYSDLINRYTHSWTEVLTSAPFQEWLVLFLILAIAWYFFGRSSPTIIPFLSVPVLFYFVWVGRHQDLDRFLWPVIGHLSVIQGSLLAQALSRNSWTRAIAVALITALLASFIQFNNADPLLAALRVVPRSVPADEADDYYLKRHFIDRSFGEAAAKRLEPTDRVLVLGTLSGYYAAYRTVEGDPFMQGWLNYHAFQGSAELHHALTQRGITHLAIDDTFVGKSGHLDSKARSLIRALVTSHADPVLQLGSQKLYRLKSAQLINN